MQEEAYPNIPMEEAILICNEIIESLMLEREHLIAALSKAFPSWKHEGTPGKVSICFPIPSGTCTWPVADIEDPLFSHLEYVSDAMLEQQTAQERIDLIGKIPLSLLRRLVEESEWNAVNSSTSAQPLQASDLTS